ncbi:MAG: DNA polymerase IV [Bdellovibrionales bacterium CG12_big_fil_rev_8_21_14_0_65_38_15]|nr:MAG: DNA polymerase IV [Bdellovibrionales bacterium CG22_combo_CG10-13_8_21_14_all_38_13]PIQ54229.1 MAG: DNA polymerase IV [Bdellovibrionales bacterium CG12_big_fil_rev_8_21_14_0_65_38_15]PIR29287.1 MAG: DNA polymerase IV [Bdellovibrionales bacterium CG11_big_fil_rev_8_21_14_0_20_38_13]
MFDAESLKLKVLSQHRKIIHIDMDSFYASVEMRDHPEWRNVPLAVGGPPGTRAVLSTCNYQARKFGVKSAMPSSLALRLCPELLIVPGRMSVYKEVSNQIHEIFKKYTDSVEPLSLDEAYLDVTDSEFFNGSATLIAKQIRNEIFEVTGLTASAGIAPNKFLAKLSSDWNKPNGQFTISPQDISTFIINLPLAKLPGIGAKTAQSLERRGFKTCQDIQIIDLFTLRKKFGNYAHRLFELSFGYDDNEVITDWLRKSLGVEETFQDDLEIEDSLSQLSDIYLELERRFDKFKLKHLDACAHKLFVKIKTHDFKQHSFERVLDKDQKDLPHADDFYIMLKDLLLKYNTPVRLIGAGIRLSYENGPEQLNLEYDMAN